jgi:hypothetical protein
MQHPAPQNEIPEKYGYWWELNLTFMLFEQVMDMAWKEKEEAAKLLQGFSYVPNENTAPPSLKLFLRWMVDEERRRTKDLISRWSFKDENGCKVVRKETLMELLK